MTKGLTALCVIYAVSGEPDTESRTKARLSSTQSGPQLEPHLHWAFRCCCFVLTV